MTIPIRAEKQPRHETFRFWTRVWDVEKAKAIIAKKKRKPVEGDLSGWWTWVGDEKGVETTAPDGSKITKMKLGMVYVDWKYVRKIKTERMQEPLIMVTLKDPKKPGEKFNLIIDGWHRLACAKLADHKTMKVYLLNLKESKEIELA